MIKKHIENRDELLQKLESNKKIYWKNDNFEIQSVYVTSWYHEWVILNKKTNSTCNIFFNDNEMAGKPSDYYYYIDENESSEQESSLQENSSDI